MSDIWVHARMRKCCRETLGKLDKARAYLRGKRPELAQALGDLTLDQAAAKVPSLLPLRSNEDAAAEVVEICASLCAAHASTHAAEGATSEAGFWQVAEAVVRSKEPPKITLHDGKSRRPPPTKDEPEVGERLVASATEAAR